MRPRFTLARGEAWKGRGPWLVCLVLAPLLFAALASTNVEAQGLQYDELFQAPAAFLWLGKTPFGFVFCSWKGIPLLTMPYAGAIKSNVYGIWMKATGHPFSVGAWRGYGILLASAGLAAFVAATRRAIGNAGTVLFCLLFLSDVTLLLIARSDGGPSPGLLAMRLVWIAVWLAVARRGESTVAEALALGLIPALCVYEKLNNVVMLVPLALAVLGCRALRTPRALASLAAGFVVGSLPLVAANVIASGISFATAHGAIQQPPVRPSLPSFAVSYLGMAYGGDMRGFVLGHSQNDWLVLLEAGLQGLLLASVVALALWCRRDSAAPKVLVLVGSYLGIGLATWMLPAETWIVHWVVGLPFQYAAFALVPQLSGSSDDGVRSRQFLRRLTWGLLVVLLASRAVNVFETERGLVRGDSSEAYDPSYTAVACFAARHEHDANFVLADWGFATSIQALSNGDLALSEPFNDYAGPDQLRRLLVHPGQPVYVLSNRNRNVFPASDAIRSDARQLLRGRTLPLEPELVNLRAVRVEKYAWADVEPASPESP